MDHLEALGTLAILGEQSVKQNSPKLSPQQLRNLSDAEAVLATYVFDMATRVGMMFEALEQFAPLANVGIARDMKLHYETISAGATWQERASTAHDRLLAVNTRIGDRAIKARDLAAGAF